MPRSSKTYTISQLARDLAISSSSIRFYEEKGLVRPSRTPGNQRLYAKRDRARLKLILRGKRLGFSLDEIAQMIGLANTQMSEIDQIESSLAFADRKLDQIARRRTELELLEQDIRSNKSLLLDRLATLKAQRK